MLAIRPLTVTIKRSVYQAAEYWQLCNPPDGAPNQSQYIHHAIYCLGTRYWQSKRKKSLLFSIGREYWFIGSWIDSDRIDDSNRQFHPLGESFQLMPCADYSHFTEYRKQHAIPIKVDIKPWHKNELTITLKDARDWRDRMVANGVHINGVLAHESDIPVTDQYLSLAQCTTPIDCYLTDYLKHDKLTLYNRDCNRFLWLVRSTGTWCIPHIPYVSPGKRTIAERGAVLSYSGVLSYAIRHERDYTIFYAYDHGQIAQIAADDCNSLLRKWSGLLPH